MVAKQNQQINAFQAQIVEIQAQIAVLQAEIVIASPPFQIGILDWQLLPVLPNAVAAKQVNYVNGKMNVTLKIDDSNKLLITVNDGTDYITVDLTNYNSTIYQDYIK